MKLSFIIPAYNAATTLKRAVASIDTKQDHEIIIINDGSTDDTVETIENLARDYKTIRVIHQKNKGAAASRNVGLDHMTGDAFMFIDADDEFLPSRIDAMAKYMERDEGVDIVIGQLARDMHGTWSPIKTHEALRKFELVHLREFPDVMQSIGPGAKLFRARLGDIRFDEDVVFCEEHTYIVQAYQKARQIQLIADLVYGYNEAASSVTAQRVDRFEQYMADAVTVRERVMAQLNYPNEQVYYSYRMDGLIVSYLLEAHLRQSPKMRSDLLETVTDYMKRMATGHYSGEAMFRFVHVIEQGTSGWNGSDYTLWKETLLDLGIGRPNAFLFQVQRTPKRLAYQGKQVLKRILRK